MENALYFMFLKRFNIKKNLNHFRKVTKMVSVWNDARTNVPEAYFLILVEDCLGDYGISMLTQEEECSKSWVRWAYIDNLLPNKRTDYYI